MKKNKRTIIKYIAISIVSLFLIVFIAEVVKMNKLNGKTRTSKIIRVD
jgi:hypothetical protein